MRQILVTGADGFTGLHLCRTLESRGYEVIRGVRRAVGPGAMRRVVPDLSSESDLRPLVRGARAVVHLAARAHVMRETAADPLAEFRRVNVEGTRRLTAAAAAEGVRRLVFLSSVGVNGPRTTTAPFRETDRPAPTEPYARSKWEAEQLLQEVAAGTDLEIVIVRPPLVYGPGVKGNFLRMLRLADSGLPLPLGSVRNRRSLIGIDNLCAFLAECVEHPAASGEIFLVAEPEVHSVPDLLRALTRTLGRPCRLFTVPEGLLRTAAAAAGMRDQLDKLCGSLEISAEKAQRVLGWTPCVSFEEGLDRTAAWFQEVRRGAA